MLDIRQEKRGETISSKKDKWADISVRRNENGRTTRRGEQEGYSVYKENKTLKGGEKVERKKVTTERGYKDQVEGRKHLVEKRPA